MNNSNSVGLLSMISIILSALAWIGSGIIAWNWIEPESFFGGLKFLIAWSVIGYIFQVIGSAIIAALINIFD